MSPQWKCNRVKSASIIGAGDRFQGRRSDWVKTKVDTGGKRIPAPAGSRTAGSGAAASNEGGPSGPNTTVTGFAREYSEFRKLLGFIWPVALFTTHEGTKPSKKAIKTYVVSGQKVRGVLRPASAGTPPGVIEWYQISQVSIPSRRKLR